MKDAEKTKDQLINELEEQKLAELISQIYDGFNKRNGTNVKVLTK